jgi:hypothetical protein
MTGNSSCLTSIFCPPPSWLMAAHCGSMGINTAFFRPKSRRPHPTRGRPQVLRHFSL